MDESIHIYTDTISFGYDISCRPTDNFTLHCHNFYEVYFFLEGNVDYLVEGQKYTPVPGSLLLLSPHTFHGARIYDDQVYRRFSLHFHPSVLAMERRVFLLSVFPTPERQFKQKIYFDHVEQYHLSTYFEALKSCAFQNQDLQNQTLPIYIEALLARIISMQEPEAYTPHSPESNMVLEIIRFLNQHLCESITLDMISERFFISKHHLNKVFRKATGTTVINYLLYKRIITAQQMLINGCSTQNAALSTGFADYSSFYRSYIRILGHPPIKDRGIPLSFSSSRSEELKIADLSGSNP